MNRTPLIVDPNIQFLDTMKADSKSFGEPRTASTGRDAQRMLADLKIRISAVFVNPTVVDPSGISVIRCAHLHRPTVPVFILYDDKEPFTEAEARGLGVREMIKKPVTLIQLLERCGSNVMIFDPKDLKPDLSHAVNSEQSIEDSKFIPIRAEDFLGGSVSFFDLYVRLNPNKYLKLLQAGDLFQIERVKTYLTKGVMHFYLKKDAQAQYMAFCDKIASSLVRNASAPEDMVATHVLNHGEETLKFFQTQGISEVKLQYASNFLKNTLDLVNRLDPGRQPILKGFLNDLTTYEHGIGVTIIASLLLPMLEVVSVPTVETVGFASLFHDIGMTGMGFKDEDEQKMTPEEVKKFRTHPTVGAEMLEKIKALNSSVIQGVAQHHERRNKKGFPEQLGGSISLVAELVGISDEFLKIVTRIKSGEKFDLQAELQHRIFDCFSPKLVNTFKAVFFFTSSM